MVTNILYFTDCVCVEKVNKILILSKFGVTSIFKIFITYYIYILLYVKSIKNNMIQQNLDKCFQIV